MVAAETTSLLESENFTSIRVGEELIYKAKFAGLVAGKQIIAIDNFLVGRPKWIDQLVTHGKGIIEIYNFFKYSDCSKQMCRIKDDPLYKINCAGMKIQYNKLFITSHS